LVAGSEDKVLEQACCDCMIAFTVSATGTKIDLSLLDTCLEIAAQQECDVQCKNIEAIKGDFKGRQISPHHF
jgi:hypothetical protein